MLSTIIDHGNLTTDMGFHKSTSHTNALFAQVIYRRCLSPLSSMLSSHSIRIGKMCKRQTPPISPFQEAIAIPCSAGRSDGRADLPIKWASISGSLFTTVRSLFTVSPDCRSSDCDSTDRSKRSSLINDAMMLWSLLIRRSLLRRGSAARQKSGEYEARNAQLQDPEHAASLMQSRPASSENIAYSVFTISI